MSKHLQEQVERICDEADSKTMRIIVQTKTADDGIQHLLEAARDVIERRSQSVSARDLMPPEAKLLKRKKITPALKRSLRGRSAQSMASGVTVNAVTTATRKALESAGKNSLRSVMNTGAVKELANTRRTRGESRLVSFWSSGSFVLEAKSKKALVEFAKDEEIVYSVADIYANRNIEVPTPADVKNLPGAVGEAENEISTWGLQKTNSLAAWGAFGAKGKGVKVAVLDTGVDASHPTLVGRVTKFGEFDRNGATVLDGDASIAYDSGKHGTHCCGTVAGQLGGPNGTLQIGMAPEAELFGGLVLKGGSGTDAQILAGMEWAIQKKADVISMSLGGLRMTPDVFDTYTRTIITANRLGIPVVIAMGNDGHQTSGVPGNDYFAFTVGATDVEDRVAGFSGGQTQIINNSRFIDAQFLPLAYRKPDVSAPGVAVYSCIPGNKFASWNGTSMATPHVAGALAQILSATTIRQVPNVNQQAYLLQEFLTATVDELGESGQDQRYGYGRIDVLRAIGYAGHQGYGR